MLKMCIVLKWSFFSFRLALRKITGGQQSTHKNTPFSRLREICRRRGPGRPAHPACARVSARASSTRSVYYAWGRDREPSLPSLGTILSRDASDYHTNFFLIRRGWLCWTSCHALFVSVVIHNDYTIPYYVYTHYTLIALYCTGLCCYQLLFVELGPQLLFVLKVTFSNCVHP